MCTQLDAMTEVEFRSTAAILRREQGVGCAGQAGIGDPSLVLFDVWTYGREVMPDATGCADVLGHGRVSMLHFDAHADTGDIEFGSHWGHGQPMRVA